jgi:hypothetical protein
MSIRVYFAGKKESDKRIAESNSHGICKDIAWHDVASVEPHSD